mmetsp:Transcript_94509/g.266866  ORF Transcript_94509/g.266866 Transcript_94509/m.266866 type:complete len:125 (-) Transcript_94509:1695-2069(-)
MSQGYSLVQLRAGRGSNLVASVSMRAASEFRRLANATRDARLFALASRLASGTKGQFTKVLQAIDMMVALSKGARGAGAHGAVVILHEQQSDARRASADASHRRAGPGAVAAASDMGGALQRQG